METQAELQKQKDAVVMGIFWLSLSLVGIFGVPAVLGFFLGAWLDTRFETQGLFRFVVLACAFILSWVVVFRWYRSSKRKLDAINQKLQALKNSDLEQEQANNE